ncbi:SIR2 family protein [Sphingobium tyrosinilyticum]|uniref:SIR2 family protein n=1 Tax=Sphingobium tyrosinilyticum TaxID=2715436 RepID=A0ABV9EWD5_9SPHN
MTTNFDTLFEQAQSGLVMGRDLHSGPVLPIPRNDHVTSWRSIVYLHGRLASAEETNDHLVLTSADFGRAYLTEAWAARFVARLFADFTVLFIGYSLNDPVLRYMTDAFAAEDGSARGRPPRGPAYIFLPYKGRIPPDAQHWRERNLEPIFYNQMRRHSQLRRTLVAWANAREDYLSNTGVMIARIAPSKPETLHPSDVDNLVWATIGREDDAGHGARIFAAISPPPPIQWLTMIARHEQEALQVHQMAVEAAHRDGRDAPPLPPRYLNQLFPKITDGHRRLDPTAFQLMTWLTRHLSTLDLVTWIIDRLRESRWPHPSLREAIRAQLLAETSLPEGYRRFWRILSAEGNWAWRLPRYFVAWDLAKLLRAEPGGPWTARELAAALRPVLTLSQSFYSYWHGDDEAALARDYSRLSHLAEVEVELADDEHVETILTAIEELSDSDQFCGEHLHLFVELLRDVLDLYSVAGEADDFRDPSAMQRPSIEPHAQNNNHQRWTRLFDLIWRGWCWVEANDGPMSRNLVEGWRRAPYPAFRRLTLAAVRRSSQFSPAEKLEVLLNG